MAGREQYILRIPRSDDEGSPILLQVLPAGSASRPLDARLVATESEAPYVLSCKSFCLAFVPLRPRPATALPGPTPPAAARHLRRPASFIPAWG